MQNQPLLGASRHVTIACLSVTAGVGPDCHWLLRSIGLDCQHWLVSIACMTNCLMRWWVWLPQASTGLCTSDWQTSLKSVVGHVQVSLSIKN